MVVVVEAASIFGTIIPHFHRVQKLGGWGVGGSVIGMVIEGWGRGQPIRTYEHMAITSLRDGG